MARLAVSRPVRWPAQTDGSIVSLVISKGIKLIDLVSEGIDSLADLAGAAGLSRSTAHRILAALTEHNYLSLDSRRYTLGYRLLELGEQKKRSLSFIDLLHPILVRYADMTSETIHLAILDGRDIVLIDRVPGSRQLQIASYVGQRSPAFMTAVGKALISMLPTERWKDYLGAFPAGYRKTPAGLRRELKRARETGFAFDMDECDIGTCGVAAGFEVNETLRVAASINGATVYFGGTRLEDLGPTAVQMCRDLRHAIVDIRETVRMPTAARRA